MCKSVKGAAFFGSSIHVVASFVFLLWFLFDTVITEVHINLWRCVSPSDDPPKNYNVLVHYLNLPFKFLYYCCLCVTGIYIFRGVERNAPRVIKFALLVFVIVQIIGLTLFITISFNYWENEEANAIHVQARHSGNGPNNDNSLQYLQKHKKMPFMMPPLPKSSRLVDPNGVDFDANGSGSEEDGNYTIQIEVISHSPDSGESKEVNDEGMKAVLESPIEPTILATSPMPPPPPTEGNEPEGMEPMSPEVVLVKVVKESGTVNSKLAHNQLVQLVFQVFLVGFNAVGSFIYTGIILIHLTSL